MGLGKVIGRITHIVSIRTLVKVRKEEAGRRIIDNVLFGQLTDRTAF